MSGIGKKKNYPFWSFGVLSLAVQLGGSRKKQSEVVPDLTLKYLTVWNLVQSIIHVSLHTHWQL